MMESLFDVEPVATIGKSNEWYTPAKYINAARKVMGTIDLDPASCEEANQTVKANHYYSKEDDGLSKEWHGNIWLNPPYLRTKEMKARHQSTIGLFVRKLVEEYESSNVEQAILLVTAQTEARWFYPLWQFPVCFPDHVVHFARPYDTDVAKYGQMHGTLFVYLGPNEVAFIEHFSPFGRIAKAIDVPRAKPTTLPLWEGGAA